MSACTYCAKPFGFFENLINRAPHRCKECESKLTQVQQSTIARLNQLFAQGGVPRETERDIAMVLEQTRLPQDLAQVVLGRLTYLRNLTEIQRGNVPRIRTSIHLDSDEYAHFEMRVVYYKPLKTIRQVPGRLIGTNKKCYFISDSGSDSATLDWNNVSQVYDEQLSVPHTTKVNGKNHTTYTHVQALHLSVAKGAGGGGYSVSDRLYTKILIDTIVRMWKRQLVIYAETKTHGAVPEHVKAAVFQRDQGRCVQCGYEGEYIEYDHKYPRSKGGQNTVENIQLLCRMCNLKKGDRI